MISKVYMRLRGLQDRGRSGPLRFLFIRLFRLVVAIYLTPAFTHCSKRLRTPPGGILLAQLNPLQMKK